MLVYQRVSYNPQFLTTSDPVPSEMHGKDHVKDQQKGARKQGDHTCGSGPFCVDGF